MGRDGGIFDDVDNFIDLPTLVSLSAEGDIVFEFDIRGDRAFS